MNVMFGNRTVAQADEPVACLVRHRTVRTPARIAVDGIDHLGDWSEWREASLNYGLAVTDPSRNYPQSECQYEMRPLYTRPQQAARWVRLTADDVWQSNEVMALNAEMGLPMAQIMALIVWADAKLREKNGGAA